MQSRYQCLTAAQYLPDSIFTLFREGSYITSDTSRKHEDLSSTTHKPLRWSMKVGSFDTSVFLVRIYRTHSTSTKLTITLSKRNTLKINGLVVYGAKTESIAMFFYVKTLISLSES